MHAEIQDACFPPDSLTVDSSGVPGLLYLALKTGPRVSVVALDFNGAAELAEVLAPFLRNHPDVVHSGLIEELAPEEAAS